jgi:hypothetical protein
MISLADPTGLLALTISLNVIHPVDCSQTTTKTSEDFIKWLISPIGSAPLTVV